MRNESKNGAKRAEAPAIQLTVGLGPTYHQFSKFNIDVILIIK
jgi:hypothetical protein